jgi:hypothetical protein
LAPLDLVHSGLCEMNGLLTRGGNRYFMTFIDDASRFCYIFLLKSKVEALHYFKIYKAEVKNQLERKIKRLRDDCGGEYTSNDCSQFCAEHGIIHEVAPPYSPQSNGVTERRNRTLTNLVNAMLESVDMHYEWWWEAILTANFVLNRVGTKNREITPYEGWNGRKPNINFLRTWACLEKVNLPELKKRKFGLKIVDCAFLGYAHNSMTYRFLVIESDALEQNVNTIMESRDAAFFENIFPMRAVGSTSLSENNHIHIYDPKDLTPPPKSFDENYTPFEEDNSLANEPTRRSKRPKIAKSFGDDFIVYLVDDVPKTLSQAYASPDAEYWKDVVRSEMDSILSNGTCEITDCPNGCKPIGCKWIFKKKLRHDGTIEKYKARLVAKGFTQKKRGRTCLIHTLMLPRLPPLECS